MPTKRFFGSFTDFEEMLKQFDGYSNSDRIPDEQRPKDSHILFASYGGGGYDGHALVLLKNTKGLFEVEGSHCSCNGLEGQWNPQPVTWEALALRLPNLIGDRDYSYFRSDHGEEATDTLVALIKRRNKIK